MRHVEAAALVRGREKFGRGDKMYLGVCVHVVVASTAAKIKPVSRVVVSQSSPTENHLSFSFFVRALYVQDDEKHSKSRHRDAVILDLREQ